MFEFRALTARLNEVMDKRSNENKDVHLPGKVATGSIRKDASKKTAFSDLKNTFTPHAIRTKPQPNNNAAMCSSSARKATSNANTFMTPKPQISFRQSFLPKTKLMPDIHVEVPLQPVDMQRCWAEKWVLNDEQIDRLLRLEDAPPEIEADQFDDGPHSVFDEPLLCAPDVDELFLADLPADPLPLLDMVPTLLELYDIDASMDDEQKSVMHYF